MKKLTVIIGSKLCQAWDETEQIPTAEIVEDMGGQVVHKEFYTPSERQAYVNALDLLDEHVEYRAIYPDNNEEKAHKSLTERIDEALKFGPVAPFYFLYGIIELNEKIDTMTDEEVSIYGGGLISGDSFRSAVKRIREHIDN